MRARLHEGTAYAVPVIGWRREIEQLNAADASAFYRRYYAPDNAVLGGRRCGALGRGFALGPDPLWRFAAQRTAARGAPNGA